MNKKELFYDVVHAWAFAKNNNENTAEIWLYNMLQFISLNKNFLAWSCFGKAYKYASPQLREKLNPLIR